FFLSFPRWVDPAARGSGRGEELAGKCPPPDSDPFDSTEFGKMTPVSQDNSQRLEPLVLATIRASNKDRFPQLSLADLKTFTDRSKPFAVRFCSLQSVRSLSVAPQQALRFVFP